MHMTFASLVGYWFRKFDQRVALSELLDFWFGTSAELDDEMRDLFEKDLLAAAEPSFDVDPDSPRDWLGAVLLFDQVPRNIYRGTPMAFAYDRKALALMRLGQAHGVDERLDLVPRMFFYCPLAHSESLADQHEMVERVQALQPSQPGYEYDVWSLFLKGAHDHRDTIIRFHRFPHRNDALGRASTPEEEHYLEQVRASKTVQEQPGGKPYELSQQRK
jgi:uncharacterized protein (DUF924 family)